MRRNILTLVALAAAMLMPPAASAEQQSQATRKQPTTQPQQDKRVRGKLQDVRTVNLKGEGKHVLAKLRMAGGKTLIVDLGRPQDLKGQKFRRNQDISVLGRAGRINGRPIIVADRLRDESRPDLVLTIVRLVPMRMAPQGQQQQQRSAQQGDAMQAVGRQGGEQQAQRRGQEQRLQRQQEQQQQQQQQRTFTHVIAGTLMETREVTLRGLSDKHVLARIQTPQGRHVLVDLGTRQDVQDVKLSRGEAIAATGTFGRINGRPVLFADRFADLVRIDRSQQAQQAGFRSGQQREPSQQPRQQQRQPQRQQEQEQEQQQQRTGG